MFLALFHTIQAGGANQHSVESGTRPLNEGSLLSRSGFAVKVMIVAFLLCVGQSINSGLGTSPHPAPDNDHTYYAV